MSREQSRAEYRPRPLHQRHCPAPMSPATEYISWTPSQPVLASPARKILIPVLGGVGSCPHVGKTSPTVPRPRYSTFRSIPACLSMTDSFSDQPTPHEPKGGSVCPCIVPQGSGGQLHLLRTTGSSCGPCHVTSLSQLQYKLVPPESLKHKLSHPTTTTTTNSIALFSWSRAILPSFLQTSKPF